MSSTTAAHDSCPVRNTPQRLDFLSSFLRTVYVQFRQHPLVRAASRRDRRLRLCETLALGDRRLVALIQLDGRNLLVGVTGNAITLLSPNSAIQSRQQPESGLTDITSSDSGASL